MPEINCSINSVADIFRSLPREDRRNRLGKLTEAAARSLIYDWEFWARPNQLLPPGDWQTWLVLAGRGFGKTRIGAEAVRIWVRAFSLVNLIAATADDARDVMVQGESGILAICPKHERPLYVPSKRRLEWPNGSVSLIFSADEPDRLRGKQSKKLWCDEVAAWRFPDAWDQAMFGLRLGKNPQVIATTTPKPTKLIRALASDRTTHITRGSTYDNKANLAPTFLSKIITKYEGTRLGRQELNAELLEDNPGALWHLTNIDDNRVSKMPEDIERSVIAIDPAATSTEYADETGIIAAARDKRRPAHFYVFDDLSMTMASPDAWAKQAVNGYKRHRADRIVGETNNGGEMVEAVIRHVDENVAYKAVHASRGKITRAEPIAALYEQGRVHHVGTFALLEDQCCDYDPATATKSPDRMDALVWALTELSEGLETLGVVEFLKAEHSAEVKKVEASRTQKVMTNPKTEACPECGSTAVTRVGGGKRCSQCSCQWDGPTQKPIGQSRKDLFK